MKIAIFLPNLTRSSGGAEVYGLYLAKALSNKHEVVIITARPKCVDYNVKSVYKKYGISDLRTYYFNMYFEGNRSLIKEYIGERMLNFSANRLIGLIKPDLFINGNQFKLIARSKRNSICISHFPPDRYHVPILKKFDSDYANSYDLFVSNSEFGKIHLKKMYGKDAVVLYPPVIFPPIKNELLKKKERIILAVDRFVPDKKILEMIEAYKALPQSSRDLYKLVIIGNKDTKEEEYYNSVIHEINGFSIEIYHDLSFEELLSWYKKAMIFWHAKGYQVSDDNPKNMEHFGMTTVEAMINGCVPVVINKAGQREIMKFGLEFLAWDDLNQFVSITNSLINDENRIRELQPVVIEVAQRFSYRVFENKANEIVERFE